MWVPPDRRCVDAGRLQEHHSIQADSLVAVARIVEALGHVAMALRAAIGDPAGRQCGAQRSRNAHCG
jgi:hypothetical protein